MPAVPLFPRVLLTSVNWKSSDYDGQNSLGLIFLVFILSFILWEKAESMEMSGHRQASQEQMICKRAEARPGN